MAKLRTTRNDLGDNAKKISTEVLNATLADIMDLNNAVHMAHWTVKGPSFNSMHLLFESFYNQLAVQLDDVAERCVQLGGTPNGTTQMVGEKTRLAPYPTDISLGMDHVKALTDRYAALAKSVREGIDATDEAGDADTADLLTEISRSLDKSLWMLESHLEK